MTTITMDTDLFGALVGLLLLLLGGGPWLGAWIESKGNTDGPLIVMFGIASALMGAVGAVFLVVGTILFVIDNITISQ